MEKNKQDEIIEGCRIRIIIGYCLITIVSLLAVYLIAKMSVAFAQINNQGFDLASEYNVYTMLIFMSASSKTEATLAFIKWILTVIAVACFLIVMILLLIRNSKNIMQTNEELNKVLKRVENKK